MISSAHADTHRHEEMKKAHIDRERERESVVLSSPTAGNPTEFYNRGTSQKEGGQGGEEVWKGGVRRWGEVSHAPVLILNCTLGKKKKKKKKKRTREAGTACGRLTSLTHSADRAAEISQPALSSLFHYLHPQTTAIKRHVKLGSRSQHRR